MHYMTWSIEPYTPLHTDALRDVFLRSRQFAFPNADPRSFKRLDFDQVIQGEIVLVAVSEGRPIGFVAWWEPDHFIHSLFVDPDFLRHGIGKSLLETCLDKLGRPATLKCKFANKRALEFYKAQGWVAAGVGESEDGPYILMKFGNEPLSTDDTSAQHT
jgi:GNAT superfamily N-acetyltransferase